MLDTELIINRLKAATGTLAIATPPTAVISLLEQLVADVANPCEYKPFYWDICDGLCELVIQDRKLVRNPVAGQGTEVTALLRYIRECPEKALFLAVGVQEFLPGGLSPNLLVLQSLINTSHVVKRSNKRLILIGSHFQVDQRLEGIVTEIEFLLPTEREREAALTQQIGFIRQSSKRGGRTVTVELNTPELDEIVRSLGGLTKEEADDLLLLASFQKGRIDGETAQFVNQQRVTALKRQNLELWLPTDLVPAVGFDQFDAWCQRKLKLFHPDAQQYGLDFPNGVVLFGPPGTGKTLAIKNLALTWQLPVLKLNLGNLLTSALGGSEGNLNRLLKTIEQLSVIVLIDEIEKQFAAIATNSSGGDGGTSQRLFAIFLQWLSEKAERRIRSFVAATANNLTNLPPELFRDRRWDGLFYVGLPEKEARAEILRVHLGRRKIVLGSDDLERLALTTEGLSGAELEQQLVLKCAETAFDEGRPGQVRLTELLQAASSATALSRDPQRRSELTVQLQWAAKQALFASSETERIAKPQHRQSDH